MTDAVTCPVLRAVDKWPLWKMRIRSKFDAAGVTGFAYGEVPHYVSQVASQVNSLSSAIYPSIYPSVSTHVSHSRDTWEARDRKAISIIQDHLDDTLAIEFMDAKTSKDLMTSLILKFEGTNTGPRAFLAFKGLVDTKWDGKEEISELVSRLRVYQHTLTSLGFPLDDTIYAFVLLYTLPDTPENAQLWSTITSSVAKNEVLTFAHVEAHFTTNALIRAAGKPSISSTNATSSESALSAAPSRSSQPSKFYCSLHKENASHNTPECFALKKQEAEKKGKKGWKDKGKSKSKSEAHSAQEDVSDSESESETAGAAMYGHSHVSQKSKNLISAYTASEPSLAGQLLLDSGASSSMVPHIEWFEPDSLKTLDPPRPIGFGDESQVFAVAIGTIRITTKTNIIRLHDVLLVPSFVISLISVSKLAKHGLTSNFTYGAARVQKDGKTILRAVQKSGVYRIMANGVPVGEEFAHAVVDINVMHRRFGHLNFQALVKMAKKGQIKGVKALSGKPAFCEPCHLGKHKRISLKVPRQRATRPFQLIHCDIGGPVTPASRSGSLYWITFICDYLEHPWIYFLKKKSEAQERYNQFKIDA